MTSTKQKLLEAFAPISLEEMGAIRLMNRIDTKFLLSTEELLRLLQLATNDYRIQEIAGERDATYRTVYLDTPRRDMYLAHQSGHAVREKIRVRTYVSSRLTFLEVKNKNNKGRTDKRRMPVTSIDSLEKEGGNDFLKQYAWYELQQLTPELENQFQRITLVNKAQTERLTIDCNICFHNIRTGNKASLENLVVVELKRDGRAHSPIREILHRLHVAPASFSKYCIGCALTNAELKQNRFKPRVRRAMKLNGNEYTSFQLK